MTKSWTAVAQPHDAAADYEALTQLDRRPKRMGGLIRCLRGRKSGDELQTALRGVSGDERSPRREALLVARREKRCPSRFLR